MLFYRIHCNNNKSLFKSVPSLVSSTILSKTTAKAIIVPSRLISSRTASNYKINKLLQCRGSSAATASSLRRLPNLTINNSSINNNSYSYSLLDNYDDFFLKINEIRKKPQKNNLVVGNNTTRSSSTHKKSLIVGNSITSSSSSAHHSNGTTTTTASSSPKYLLNGSSSSNDDTTKEKKSDLIVVLDLDECLIHSQFLTLGQQNDKYRQKEKRPTWNANGNKTNFCDSFCITLHEEQQNQNEKNYFTKSTLLPPSPSSKSTIVHVNKRPNLENFLKRVTSKYETYIFTAAMQVYANPVLDVILEDNDNIEQQNNRFYRDSCFYDTNLGVYVKDLNHILQHQTQQQELKRVVLIDNNPLSFLANPSNGILVSSFYDDATDDTLPAVWELLEELETLDDVRPALQHLFGLEDALNDVILSNDGDGDSSYGASGANW